MLGAASLPPPYPGVSPVKAGEAGLLSQASTHWSSNPKGPECFMQDITSLSHIGIAEVDKSPLLHAGIKFEPSG